MLRNFERVEELQHTDMVKPDQSFRICIFSQIRKSCLLMAPLYRDKFFPVIWMTHGLENANHSV